MIVADRRYCRRRARNWLLAKSRYLAVPAQASIGTPALKHVVTARSSHAKAKGALILFAVQLALNTLWSILFFGQGLAAVGIAALRSAIIAGCHLATLSLGRRAARALPAVGQLRSGPELDDLAAEPIRTPNLIHMRHSLMPGGQLVYAELAVWGPAGVLLHGEEALEAKIAQANDVGQADQGPFRDKGNVN